MKYMWIGTCDLWICRWYAEHIFNHQHELSTDPIEATLPAARRRRTSSPRHKKASLQLAFVVNLQSKLDLKTPKLDPVNCWFLTFTSPISKKTFCCISRWSVDESGPLRIGRQHQDGPNGWSLKVPGCFTAQQSYGLRTAGAPARTTSASLFSQRPYSSGKACFFFSISLAAVHHEKCWKILWRCRWTTMVSWWGDMCRFCGEVSILSMRNYHFRVRKVPFYNFAGLERKLVSVAGLLPTSQWRGFSQSSACRNIGGNDFPGGIADASSSHLKYSSQQIIWWSCNS